MSTRLYVGGVSYSSTDDSLREAFAQAGEVVSATVIKDRESGRSKGFAFVEMASDDDARNAISMFDGKEIDGRTVKVDEARPREER